MEKSADRMRIQRVVPLTLSLSFPVMVSLLVNALYNVVDSIYIARYSEFGMTAVSLTFPLQTMIAALGTGTGVGTNILMARRLGAGDSKSACSIASHGMLLSLLNWLAIVLAGAFALRPYFAFFSGLPAVREMGLRYAGILCFCSAGTLLENVTSRILHAGGDTLRPMLFQIAGAVVNILLDPVLIFGRLGAPEMGIAGAAVATVAGQFCSMSLSLHAVLRSGAISRFSRTQLRWSTAAEVLSAGKPTVIMASLVSLYIAGLNAVLAPFSDAAVAVLGIYYKLQTFLLIPTSGLCQGCTPIFSYNFGTGNYRRMWQTLWCGLAISSATLCAGTLVFLLFPRQLLQLFSADSEMLAIGIPALRIISLSFPLFGVTILMPMFYQAAGYNRLNIFVTLLRQVILLVPVAWLLSHWGLGFVWYTYPISEFLSALLCVYYTCRLHREFSPGQPAAPRLPGSRNTA